MPPVTSPRRTSSRTRSAITFRTCSESATRCTREQSRMSKEEADELSVRLELQADFLAGVSGAPRQQRMEQILEPGDVEKAPQRGGRDR